ncbi:Uncharacterized protein Fot_15703 [Forsythia ovata]|uniref:Uncharacterized protein n=1 Tax=Forsythia ovata TaxID=205694 RepID=A0ABD1WDD7_9LAMI
MALRHRIHRVRFRVIKHDPNRAHVGRSMSQSLAQAFETPLPSPISSNRMVYHQLAKAMKSKLKRLENPDSRFLKYASSYHILSLPEAKKYDSAQWSLSRHRVTEKQSVEVLEEEIENLGGHLNADRDFVVYEEKTPRRKIYNSSASGGSDDDDLTFAMPRALGREKKKKNIPSRLRISTSSTNSVWFSIECGVSVVPEEIVYVTLCVFREQYNL